MARKRNIETVKEPKKAELPVADTCCHSEHGGSCSGLAGEVRSLLQRRDELAQKLTAEIAATEQKLAELRQSIALLMSEQPVEPSAF